MALFIGSARDAPDKYARAEAATREMAGLFREPHRAPPAAPKDDLLSELVQLEEAATALPRTSWWRPASCCSSPATKPRRTISPTACSRCSAFPQELEARASPRSRRRRSRSCCATTARSARRCGSCRRRRSCTAGRSPGERVFLLMNAANRDPRAYADPDRLDLARHGLPHLTFGFGPHICLGFPLARLEGQVALPAVLARWRPSSSPAAEPNGSIRWSCAA